MVTNMYGEKTIVAFIVFIIGLLATISFLFLGIYLGLFIPNYITDEGIRCKNETLKWEEIKITAHTFKQKSISCWLFIDRQYLSGVQNLYKKKRQGFCIALDRSQMENAVMTILRNIKTKVLFLSADGETETDTPCLSQDLLIPFLEHNKRIDDGLQIK